MPSRSAEAKPTLPPRYVSTKSRAAARLRTLTQWSGRALTAVSAVATAIDQYDQSPASSSVAKVGDAALASGASVLFGAAMPLTAAADAVSGGHVSKHLGASMSAVAAAVEGLATGDTQSMEAFQRRARAGEYNGVFKAAVEAGEYWADNGIATTLKDFAREVRDAL